MADQQQLKAQALAYFKENQVPIRMQDALNVMFKLNPPDVNGFVSTYFETLSQPPTITRIMAMRSLDSKGQPAISTRIYCISRNKEICAGESCVAYDTCLLDTASKEEKDAEDKKRDEEIDDAINLVNNEFRDILESTNPRHQSSLDEQVYEFIENERVKQLEAESASKEVEDAPPLSAQEDKKGGKKSGKGGSAKKKGPQVVIVPDKPKEKPYPGWCAVSAVSQALAKAGAAIAKEQLYDYLSAALGEDSYSVTLPLPVITICQSGKASPGKTNCVKEFMIVPRVDMAISEAVSAASKIQENIVKNLFVKAGVGIKYYNDFGAICPTLDKVEQGLDMIAEGMSQAGYEIGKDFFFMLNSSAQECFDCDKGKYEVLTGVFKAPEDMADFWNDLCNRYSSIIGIIDPIRSEEKESWNKICSAISHSCLVIGDKAYSRPGLLKNETLDFHQLATSGIVLRFDGPNTVSDVVACSKKMAEHDNAVLLACGQNETNDTTIIDVAIACKARFIKVGAVSRGERIIKLNRLIDIENELGERKKEWKPLTFPPIPPRALTPTPEPDGDQKPEE